MSYVWGNTTQVLENREKFISKLHFSLDDCIAMKTSDSQLIKEVVADDRSKGMHSIESAIKADCIWTKEPNLGLWLVTADCIPLVLWNSCSNCLSVCHISRKNVHSQIIHSIVKIISNGKPEKTHVYFGPFIQKESYFFDNIHDLEPKSLTRFASLSEDRAYLDMATAVSSQLLALGILNNHIKISNIDTMSSSEYFSHRKSFYLGKEEGRFATIAWIELPNHSK